VLANSKTRSFDTSPKEEIPCASAAESSVEERASSATSLTQSQALRFAARLHLWQRLAALRGWTAPQARAGSVPWPHPLQHPVTLDHAARVLEVSIATLSRIETAVSTAGLDGLRDDYHLCGRTPTFRLHPAEVERLRRLYLQSNRAADAGSMLAAQKLFTLDPDTREELRAVLVTWVDASRIHPQIKRILQRITPTHFAAARRPAMAAHENFAGTYGAFADDKIQRRLVVESDDGTLNFGCWIPWEMGGDKCSDKYGVKLMRAQFLPAIECGWSQAYLSSALICRQRGSYNNEDVRQVIWSVGQGHGLPHTFRFERGTWESQHVTELLTRLGVELTTVYQPSGKPYVEGGFAKLWTYLSLAPGQVGRYRGEMEREGILYQACQAGHKDPRNFFPSLTETLNAIDAAIGLHNSDTIKSRYGSWVPGERLQQTHADGLWRPLPDELEYLCAPLVREWTVRGATVGGKVSLFSDSSVPYYFEHEVLWRWNGRLVRLYFDPLAQDCSATIVCVNTFGDHKPGDVICRATILDTGLPAYARAQLGLGQHTAPDAGGVRKSALAALRRELRTYSPTGRVTHSVSDLRDGRGRAARVRTESGIPNTETMARPSVVSPIEQHAPARSTLSIRLDRLARARAALDQQSMSDLSHNH